MKKAQKTYLPSVIYKDGKAEESKFVEPESFEM